jgi:hypothetical protein
MNVLCDTPGLAQSGGGLSWCGAAVGWAGEGGAGSLFEMG